MSGLHASFEQAAGLSWREALQKWMAKEKDGRGRGGLVQKVLTPALGGMSGPLLAAH